MNPRLLLVVALAGGLVLVLEARGPGPASRVAFTHPTVAAHLPAALDPGGPGSFGAPGSFLEPSAGDDLFRTSDRCIACHKGVTTRRGIDVSIGYDWRASMMANSARDPYWQASVRREVLDHPGETGAIEAECSRCHMPMANVAAVVEGGEGSVFANLPAGAQPEGKPWLASDGVSCAVCHQIAPEGLGSDASFTGGFVVDEVTPTEGRAAYGPFEPDPGGRGIMHSATGFQPREGAHVQSSDLCATCHTLFTHAILDGGAEGPEFPEQVPYLEWRASSYVNEASCQDCHMPEVEEPVPVTGVLGRERENVSRHVFRGGNFFMLRMLNRYRDELGVVALPQELALAADRTEDHLRDATAVLTIERASVADGRLDATVEVVNTAGHKFPTAYPSRRAWLHVVVEDARGRTVFESGAFSPDGRIVGNDADEDPGSFEPHHDLVSDPGQVQVYEGVMVDEDGEVTTGLLSATRWVKDNRLLPRGFDPALGGDRVAVRGAAESDASFEPGVDRVRYSVPVASGAGPFTIRAELWFQPIAFRWAQNLRGYDSFETRRFVRYYEAMAGGSALPLATALRDVP